MPFSSFAFLQPKNKHCRLRSEIKEQAGRAIAPLIFFCCTRLKKKYAKITYYSVPCVFFSQAPLFKKNSPPVVCPPPPLPPEHMIGSNLYRTWDRSVWGFPPVSHLLSIHAHNYPPPLPSPPRTGQPILDRTHCVIAQNFLSSIPPPRSLRCPLFSSSIPNQL